jgi:hypothetical protein
MKNNQPTQTNESELSARTVPVKFVHQAATPVCIAGASDDGPPEIKPLDLPGNGRRISKPVLATGVGRSPRRR